MRRTLATALLPLLIFAALTATSQNSERSLTFAVMGDSGQIGSGQRKTSDRMSLYRDTTGFDFVLMLGDNVYPNGIGRGIQAQFEEPFGALIADGVKFYAVLGNHDIRRGEELQLAYDKFNMNGHNYYSFVKANGLIEFFAVDSTVLDQEIDGLEKKEIEQLKKATKKLHSLQSKTKLSDKQAAQLQAMEAEIAESQAFLDHRGAIVAAQLPWLKEELADSRARWKVVFLHHSIYSSAYRRGGHGKSPRVLRIRAILEPILLANKVDVVFSGHDHTYERTIPLPPDSPDGNSVQYFVQGSASKLRPHDLDRTSPFFAAGEDSRNSFLVVQTKNSSMHVQAIDADGRIIDRYEISKN